MADVSRGTVDRVLNNRGKVSEKARRKVEEVLQRIDYRPNLIARTLKNHRPFTIWLLMPDHINDRYWQQMYQGVMDAYAELEPFGIRISSVRMGSTADTYYQNFSSVLQNSPDALVIVPFFTDTCFNLYRELEERKIPFVLLNSPIKDVNYGCFIGQDYFMSGRTAAYFMDILTRSVAHKRTILILHIGVQTENATHVEEKEIGFLDYFRERDASSTIEIIRFEAELHVGLLDHKLSKTDGLFITNSKTHVAEDLLRKHPSVKIIGYDMIPENIELLREGTIDILLNQNPKLQGYHGISIVTEYLLYQREMPKNKLLPIDIITKENLSGYL